MGIVKFFTPQKFLTFLKFGFREKFRLYFFENWIFFPFLKNKNTLFFFNNVECILTDHKLSDFVVENLKSDKGK